MIDEQVDRAARQSQLTVLRRDIGEGLPLVAHRRAPLDQLPDDVDQCRAVALPERLLEAVDPRQRGGKLALASSRYAWRTGQLGGPEVD